MFIYVNMFIILIKLLKLERMIIRLSSTNTCLYSGLCICVIERGPGWDDL